MRRERGDLRPPASQNSLINFGGRHLAAPGPVRLLCAASSRRFRGNELSTARSGARAMPGSRVDRWIPRDPPVHGAMNLARAVLFVSRGPLLDELLDATDRLPYSRNCSVAISGRASWDFRTGS